MNLKVVVTSKCQLNCNGCSAEKWRKANPDYEMTIEQVFNLIRVCKESNYHFDTIIISGGEPTLWPLLPEACKMLIDANIGKVQVWSNGVNIDVLRSISGKVDIRVSGHSKNSQYQEELRTFATIKEKGKFYLRANAPVEGSLPAKCHCPHITITGDTAYGCSLVSWILQDVPDNYKTPVRYGFLDRLHDMANEPICMICEANDKVRTAPVNSQNTIAICTSCHNYGKYIADWATGILSQTRKPDLVCFYNNGSTDETSLSAQLWGAKFTDHGIRFRYDEGDKVDFGVARNKCIEMADTDWAMHHDVDDILLEHALEDWEKLSVDADVVQFGLIGFPLTEWYNHRQYKHIQLYESCAAAGSSSPFRLSMFPRYREDLPSSWDTFLWVDFAKKGARFVPTTRPCYKYRVHSDSIFHNKKQEEKNMLNIKAKAEMAESNIPQFRRYDDKANCVVRGINCAPSNHIVYSAVFEGPVDYDILQHPQADVPHICFMDIPKPMKMNGWDCRPQVFNDPDPRKRSRHHKAMSHILFPGQDTLWVDGNVIPMHRITTDKDIISNPHPHGLDCSYAEGNRCLNNKRVKAQVSLQTIREQLARYRAEGLPEHIGSPETCSIFRKSNERTKKFNEIWWDELQTCIRDQISFGYAKWKSGVSLDLFPKQIRINPMFKKEAHISKIYTFSPSDRRGIGYAYNNVCKIVPNSDCWICLTDLDIMCLPATFNFQLEDVINRHGSKYDLFTCYATRLFTDSRCLNGKRSEERDLVKLRNMVLKPYHEKYAQVKPINTFTGYLMLFKKSLWEETPFPLTDDTGKTTVLGVDTKWARQLRCKGKKIGMMEGVAVIHYYRLGEEDGKHRKYLEEAGNVKIESGSPVDVGVSEMEPANKDIIIWQLCRQSKSTRDLLKRAKSMHIYLDHDTDGRVWYVTQTGHTVEIKASPTIAHPNCLMAKQ